MKLFDATCNYKIPDVLPVIPTVDVVAFPHMIIPLLVVDQRIIRGIQQTMDAGTKMVVLLVCKKQSNNSAVGAQDLYKIGTVATIIRVIPLHDGSMKVLVQGVSRVDATDIHVDETLCATIKPILHNIQEENETVLEHKINLIKNIVSNAAQSGNSFAHDFHIMLSKITSYDKIADFILSHITLSVNEAQKLLEARTYAEFFDVVSEFLIRESEIVHLQERVKNRARDSINSAQKEFYVREQIKALKQELGEESNESENFRSKLAQLSLSEETYKEIEQTINRFEHMNAESAETAVLRTYLECILDLPWDIETTDNEDIARAKHILDEEHFGLNHVKEHILDFLSVRSLSTIKNGAILCFYGPPGTGKTSLAQSIANALGRKYFRISVGGLKDEAEIRGHRRTYVGAIPGRIIKGIKQVQSKNPVIVIDEIDKIGNEVRGDPASALLEVLDYQQNHNFYDHYLAVPFDLSKVFFIATANRLDTIPHALRDRMELIELSAYTLEEKKHIAKKYFIPRVLKEAGLEDKNIIVEDEIFETIISDYTCEAGVRDLERWMKRLASKIARTYLEKGNVPTIKKENIEEFLGVKRFIRDEYCAIDKIGIVCGLSWTSYGGEIIRIEAVKMKGKGNLILTGQLGDVMKESAQAALTFIRAQAAAFNIDSHDFSNYDVHIHVPAGAIPKDGPSAGVAILTALASIFTQKKVSSEFAMTGEIDLQGNVLPVGGIKEKILAAKRHGIKKILLPWQNKHDLQEIQEAIADMEIFLIRHVNEALEKLLEQEEAIVETLEEALESIIYQEQPLTTTEPENSEIFA